MRTLEKLPLFVYGTLMKSEPNHSIMEKFSPPEPQIGKLTDYVMTFASGSFPAIHSLPQIRGTAVYGQIFDISQMPDEGYEELIARLDRLEAEGIMYHRKVVQVMLGDGSQVQANAYVWAMGMTNLGPVIPWGYWGKWELGADPRALFEQQFMKAKLPGFRMAAAASASLPGKSKVNFWAYGEEDSPYSDDEDDLGSEDGDLEQPY